MIKYFFGHLSLYNKKANDVVLRLDNIGKNGHFHFKTDKVIPARLSFNNILILII